MDSFVNGTAPQQRKVSLFSLLSIPWIFLICFHSHSNKIKDSLHSIIFNSNSFYNILLAPINFYFSYWAGPRKKSELMSERGRPTPCEWRIDGINSRTASHTNSSTSFAWLLSSSQQKRWKNWRACRAALGAPLCLLFSSPLSSICFISFHSFHKLKSSSRKNKQTTLTNSLGLIDFICLPFGALFFLG